MLDELELYVLHLKMQTPFGHARATRDLTENLVAVAHIGDFVGLGEGVPRDYVTGETADGAFDAIQRADPLPDAWRATDFSNSVVSLAQTGLPHRFRQGAHLGQAAACTVELAVLDALCRKFQEPLYAAARHLGLHQVAFRDPAQSVPVTRVLDFNRTMVEMRGASPVFHHVKIKVGRSAEEDEARIAETREVVGPHVPISLDANMAWDLPTAQARVDRFQRFNIAWYEEPLPQRDWASYQALRKTTGARILLDESACTAEDVETAAKHQACDIINIRLSKCGGFLASCKLADLAVSLGLGFQLGAQVGQSGILWAAGRHFASTFRDLLAYEGGGTRKLFEKSLTSLVPFVDSATFRHQTPEGPGLGTALERGTLEASVARRAIWKRGEGWTS
ncbi:MAG: enolase C-terminal domain-like protein [Myxococcaceae bacterium]